MFLFVYLSFHKFIFSFLLCFHSSFLSLLPPSFPSLSSPAASCLACRVALLLSCHESASLYTPSTCQRKLLLNSSLRQQNLRQRGNSKASGQSEGKSIARRFRHSESTTTMTSWMKLWINSERAVTTWCEIPKQEAIGRNWRSLCYTFMNSLCPVAVSEAFRSGIASKWDYPEEYVQKLHQFCKFQVILVPYRQSIGF